MKAHDITADPAAINPSSKLRVLMLIQDGVSLRNFYFSRFPAVCAQSNVELLLWAPDSIMTKAENANAVKLPSARLHAATTLFKQIKIAVALKSFSKRYKRDAYRHYYFPAFRKTGLSARRMLLKFAYTVGKWWYSGGKSSLIQSQLEAFETGTTYFKACLQQLEAIEPHVLFCTSQRQAIAIAPVQAARQLGIPVLTHIFSWDNLPKATMIIQSDYYSVWSAYMENELRRFYSSTKPHQIFITGAPQFEMYHMPEYRESRTAFCHRNKLDEALRYVCFSGDDEVTSPFDAFYLRDLAKAIRTVNSQNSQRWGVLFRRVPVDKSSRYNEVIAEYADVIFSVDPLWNGSQTDWASVLPQKHDCMQLVSTVRFSEAVFNIGSSMVFDFINFKKPCYFLNYEVEENITKVWNTKKIYGFIHFDSMPSANAVKWINNAQDFLDVLYHELPSGVFDAEPTEAWYNVIVQHPTTEASERLVSALKRVAETCRPGQPSSSSKTA